MNQSNKFLRHDAKGQDVFQQLNRSPEGVVATATFLQDLSPFGNSAEYPHYRALSSSTSDMDRLMRVDTSDLFTRTPVHATNTTISSTDGTDFNQQHRVDRDSQLPWTASMRRNDGNTSSYTRIGAQAWEPQAEWTSGDVAAAHLLQQQERHTDDALLALVVARNWSQQQHRERMRRLQHDLQTVRNWTGLVGVSDPLSLSLPLVGNGSVPSSLGLPLVGNGMQNPPSGWRPNDWRPASVPSEPRPIPTHISMRDPSQFLLSPRPRGIPRTMPVSLPAPLARPADVDRLSDQQYFLRSQIEVFAANAEDVATHIRGRNKALDLGQVGLRCRHCAHLPIYKRQKGAVYFPFKIQGIYQATQNMWTIHLQSGVCSELPEEVSQEFTRILEAKRSGAIGATGAGRPYWVHSAKQFGLVDTADAGIRFAPIL